MNFPHTYIWRHKRERLAKCSLRGLETRAGFDFFLYPDQELPSLTSHVLLTLDAPPLSSRDAAYGILLLDGTWRYAQRMERQLTSQPLPRSIPPGFVTAYPREQTGCLDPSRGLASIEALYVAYWILGRPLEGLLDHYYWKNNFFDLNKSILGQSNIY